MTRRAVQPPGALIVPLAVWTTLSLTDQAWVLARSVDEREWGAFLRLSIDAEAYEAVVQRLRGLTTRNAVVRHEAAGTATR